MMGLCIVFRDKNGKVVDEVNMRYSTFTREIVFGMGHKLRYKYVVSVCDGYYTGDYAKIVYAICRNTHRCQENVALDAIHAMEFL